MHTFFKLIFLDPIFFQKKKKSLERVLDALLGANKAIRQLKCPCKNFFCEILLKNLSWEFKKHPGYQKSKGCRNFYIYVANQFFFWNAFMGEFHADSIQKYYIQY